MPRFMIVILGQMLVIVSLSSWLYVEYLSNFYLREYVGNFLLADGWILVVLAIMVAMGSFTSLIFRKKPLKRISEVSAEPVVVQLPVRAEAVAPKAETAFHPAVAALRADIAGRRAAFGSMPVAEPIPEKVEPKQMLPLKTVESMMPAVQPVRPRFVPPPGPMFNPARPFPPRPPVPSAPVGGAPVPAVTQPPPRAIVPSPPRNVTTVITGIMPVQKKKEPVQPSDEGKSSDQGKSS